MAKTWHGYLSQNKEWNCPSIMGWWRRIFNISIVAATKNESFNQGERARILLHPGLVAHFFLLLLLHLLILHHSFVRSCVWYYMCRVSVCVCASLIQYAPGLALTLAQKKQLQHTQGSLHGGWLFKVRRPVPSWTIDSAAARQNRLSLLFHSKTTHFLLLFIVS